MYFMYVDECKSPDTEIVSMTAMLVQSDQYSDIRKAFYACLDRFFYPHGFEMLRSLPELKGSKFLPGYDDDQKINLMSNLVDIVVQEELTLLRAGYRKNSSLEEKLNKVESRLQFCWFSLVEGVRKIIGDSLVVPVLDSHDNYLR